MIKSMTAYSRASKNFPWGRLVVEIHSVNRKMLDMSIFLPKDFLRFDIEIRKWLSHSLERGQVTVRVNLQSEGAEGQFFSHYAKQLHILKQGWEKIAHELGYDANKMVDLPFLVSQMQSISSAESKEEEEKIQEALKTAVEEALKELMRMKEHEGKALRADIEKRLKTIVENLQVIELKKDEPLVRYRKKLLERLKDIGHLHGEAEERISREVALLAEKMDITEELVRLQAHLEQFHKHLNTQEKAVGRTLDFLMQEMHREVNTLGSKSTETEVSLYVVRIKGELDKIREQVQNIE